MITIQAVTPRSVIYESCDGGGGGEQWFFTPDGWTHVYTSVDAETGLLTIFKNGRQIATIQL